MQHVPKGVAIIATTVAVYVLVRGLVPLTLAAGAMFLLILAAGAATGWGYKKPDTEHEEPE